MNSALKPVLTPSGPQNPPVTTQLNKPIHPQSTVSTYGQPSTHIPQNLVNLSHNNPNIAHSHPNPAHQTNHYSLNVPNAPQHFSSGNPPTIPASNHPVANVSQAITGQGYSASKNIPYSGGYQPNLGHPPNQNPVPPITQTLPATQPPHHAPAPTETPTERPQSNGTPEVKSPTKPEPQENHVSLPKDKSPIPPSPAKVTEKPEEKAPTPSIVPEQKAQESESTADEKKTLPPAPATPELAEPSVAASPKVATSAPPTEETDSVAITQDETKSDGPAENTETSSRGSPSVSNESGNDETAQDVPSPPKPKEKEQKSTPPAKTTTPRTPTRKSKTPKLESDSPKTSKAEPKTPSIQKSPNLAGKSKRTRIRTQPYQSPLPEIEIITKISSSTPRSKSNDDKLIVFYKNEFLAVRNSEGSFYICQAVQNIYRSSPKIRIRWLSQDKNEKSGEIYTPDFYDNTDFDCILTNLNLSRVGKGRFRLPPAEKERTDSILKRSLAVEKGEVTSPSLTEEHPDGIDLSLYKEESQLKKRKGTKRKASSALKSGKNIRDKSKAPDESKVRKVEVKTGNKTGSKKSTTVAKAKKPAVQVEVKKPIASNRTDRAKRRSDNQNHSKVSPVVDQKKARVLAKVARKTAITSTSTKSQSAAAKNTKASKPTPPSSKAGKSSLKPVGRKSKRASRK